MNWNAAPPQPISATLMNRYVNLSGMNICPVPNAINEKYTAKKANSWGTDSAEDD